MDELEFQTNSKSKIWKMVYTVVLQVPVRDLFFSQRPSSYISQTNLFNNDCLTTIIRVSAMPVAKFCHSRCNIYISEHFQAATKVFPLTGCGYYDFLQLSVFVQRGEADNFPFTVLSVVYNIPSSNYMTKKPTENQKSSQFSVVVY